MIKLGTIVVDLQANTVSFSDSLSKMSQLSLTTSRNIQKSFVAVGTAATAMAATITASLGAALAKGEDFAFSMQRMAQQTGTSTEMFSKLAYNAKLAGVPLDNVRMALERLARTSGAAQNGQRDAVASYAALGITAKQLNGPLKDSGDLFVAVAKKLDTYRDSTAKTSLEQKLLGRSGAELAPLLHQVATGFDTASQQATLFGVVVGDKTAAQAAVLHRSIEELESISLGFALRLLTGVAPALNQVSNKIIAFVTSANGMRTVDTIAQDVSVAVTDIGTAFEFLSQHLTAVKYTLEGLAGYKFATMFAPMISSAIKAGTTFDDIGVAALKMAGRVSGISQLGSVFVPLAKGAWNTTSAMASLAKSEGIAETAAYALDLALTPLTVTCAAVAAALATVGVAFYYVKSEAEKNTGYAVTWQEVWEGSIDKVGDGLETIIDLWHKLTGAQDNFDKQWEKKQFSYGKYGESLEQHIEDRARADNDPMKGGYKDYGNGVMMTHHTKDDAPQIPQNTVDKVDHLKLKMDELAASAQAAHQMLMDAGKNVDFQRADQIAQEYTKTIIELTAALKAQHKTLTDADKAALLSSITTRVNDESQARYREELIRSTDEVLSQADAQDILTNAVGKSAEAVRAAAVAANAAKRDALQSDQWKSLSKGERANNDSAYGRNLDRTNAESDSKALLSVQDQINAQLILNSAILAGKKTREEADLAIQQAAIRKKYDDKGDTNQSALDAELATNEKLFRLKQQEANLSRAASMDPLRVYQEQAQALNDAATAARAAGVAISDMQLSATNKVNWDAYLEAIDKTTLAVGSASDGVHVFFEQMSRDSDSAAQHMHDVLSNAFNSLNQMLERLMTGQKVKFSEFFKGIAGQLAHLSIQKGEQSLAGALLGHDHKDNTNPTVSALAKTNNLLTSILAAITGKSVSGTLGSTVTSAAAMGTGSVAGGLTKDGLGILSAIPGLGFLGAFGGHMAGGGDVTAGMVYDVGEMGREKFVPSNNGKIIPNSALGSTQNFAIDARGATDPAQTEAAIHRAMAAYAPHIVAASVHQMTNINSRKPASM